MIKRSFITAGLMAAFAMTGTTALAQECAERGALDAMFCDANGDLVADAPTDESMLKDPSTLVFAYTPVEDPAICKRPERMASTSAELDWTAKNWTFLPVTSDRWSMKGVQMSS